MLDKRCWGNWCQGKVVLKAQHFGWTNIFIFEMFIFAKVGFEQSKFQNVGVALYEFYLFKLSLLRVLRINLQLHNSSVQIFFPLKRSLLLVLYEKTTLSDHRFGGWALNSLSLFKFIQVVLKVQKLRSMNVFTTEMFTFANFVQKVNFVRPHFQKMGVALSKF